MSRVLIDTKMTSSIAWILWIPNAANETHHQQADAGVNDSMANVSALYKSIASNTVGALHMSTSHEEPVYLGATLTPSHRLSMH